ncbi:hypothetical protein Dimus_003978, partial [Dionaea muscipula]
QQRVIEATQPNLKHQAACSGKVIISPSTISSFTKQQAHAAPKYSLQQPHAAHEVSNNSSPSLPTCRP